MKFSSSALLFLSASSLFDQFSAFVPQLSNVKNGRVGARTKRQSTARFMSMNMDAPPAAEIVTTEAPVIQSRGGAPVDVRYSDFLRLVNTDRVEKVTFSANGTKLLGVDTDGVRIKIEALPNDPDLLTQLTSHKVSTKL